MDFDEIYDQLKAAGVVTNQSDLSTMLGMQPNYVSSRKAKNQQPSVIALMTLWFNLEDTQQQFVQSLKGGEIPTAEQWNASSAIHYLKFNIWEEIKSMLPTGMMDTNIM